MFLAFHETLEICGLYAFFKYFTVPVNIQLATGIYRWKNGLKLVAHCVERDHLVRRSGLIPLANWSFRNESGPSNCFTCNPLAYCARLKIGQLPMPRAHTCTKRKWFATSGTDLSLCVREILHTNGSYISTFNVQATCSNAANFSSFLFLCERRNDSCHCEKTVKIVTQRIRSCVGHSSVCYFKLGQL